MLQLCLNDILKAVPFGRQSGLKSIYFGEIVDKPPILMYCQLVVMNTDMVNLGHFPIECFGG